MLPTARQIANASQPVVLQAYRQLQSEGLVKVRRTRGTVVTGGRSHQCVAILIRPHDPIHGVNAYMDTLVNGLMRLAVFHDNAPRIYVMNAQGANIERMLPETFLADLANNEIVGVFVQPYVYDTTLTDWLAARRLPFVQLSDEGAGNSVTPDNFGLLVEGLRFLLGKGCRRIEVATGFAWHSPAKVLAKTPEAARAAVSWRRMTVKSDTAVAAGQALATAWMARPVDQRADGLLLTDDWMGAGFVIEALAGGVRIPDNVRVVVGCHRDQVADLLRGCDCLTFDPLDVVKGMTALLHRRLPAPDAPPEIVQVPYRLQESGGRATGSGQWRPIVRRDCRL